MVHFFTTLRFRLMLLVFLAVLPSLGLILYSGLEQRRLAVNEAKKDVQDLVVHACVYQERVVDGARQLLSGLAELPMVQRQDGPACAALFARILEKQKSYANISAINLQGMPFASALPQPPRSQLGRSHFELARQTQDFAIGEFGIGRASGKPTLHFGYPIIVNGVVQGVVSCSVDLNHLNELVARTQMPPGAMLTVVDRDGAILARYPQSERWEGKRMPEAEIVKIVLAKETGVTEAVGIDGVRCLFAFAPLGVGSHDIFVYTGVPLKTIYAQAHRILVRNLLALGGAAVLAMVLAWVLGQFFLINRTRALVNTSQQLAGGDLEARSGISYDDGEFGQMAGAFDKMAEAMQQRDQSIRESEAKYRALIETTGTGYVIVDPQGKVLDANPEYLRLTGYDTLAEILGRSVVEWTVAPDIQGNAAAMQECAETGSIHNLEIAYAQKNGSTVAIEINATFIKDASSQKILSLVRDITDRKLAERALAEQFNFLQLLIDTIPSPIFYKDVNGVYQGCNQNLADFLGRPKEAIIGKTVFDIYPKEQAEKYFQMDQKLFQHPGTQIYEGIMGRPDGSIRNFIFNKATFVDSSGQVAGLIGVMTDITERKLSEEALSESEQRFRDITENAVEWIWETDRQGKYTFASPLVEKLLGYKPEEVLGKHFYDFFVPEGREALKDMTLAIFAAKQPFRDLINRNLRKNGEIIWLSTSGIPVLDASGNLLGYRGVDIDITERRQAQDALENANIQLKALVQDAEERNRHMAGLNDMSEMLQTCQTSEEAFAAINHFVPKFFPTDAGGLYVLRNSKNLLSSVTTWGDAPPSEELFPPDDCWAVRSGRLHRVDDPASALLCKHITAADPRAMSYLCVPLMAQSVSLGILHIRFLSCATLGRAAGELAAKQRLAVAIAENLALALANLKLRETLQNQAIRDPLTGLYNRRYLEETMERELHRSRRLKAPLGVVMMDLDHFKAFNDSFGHGAGDALLSALAHAITAGIRTEDIACRYGGEEFLLVLPGASLEATRERAENVRQAVKALQVKYQGRFLKSTTISLGVAIFPDHGHTAEEVISTADAALYRAKQAGRDRVETAVASPPAASAP